MAVFTTREKQVVKNPKTGTIEKEILLDPKYFNGTNDLFARITLHPGCAVPVHQHLGNNETYYLLKGEGEYTDEDKTLTVKAGDVTFCADGGWYTLCLPFALTPSDIATTLQGAVVERLSSAGRAEDGTPLLSFKRTNAVAAGQPFIMKPSATVTDPVFSSRDIVAGKPTPVTKTIAASATHGQTDIQMCGTYVPTPLLGTAYRFLNSSGTRLSVPNGEGELKPFRAFFVFSGYADAAAAVVNHIDDSTPSAISTPFAGGATEGGQTAGASNKEKATPVYDLFGRKVNKTQPSHSPRIVIMNGRKTVERSR